jgi:ssDNA-specific exonuclease RecJ
MAFALSILLCCVKEFLAQASTRVYDGKSICHPRLIDTRSKVYHGMIRRLDNLLSATITANDFASCYPFISHRQPFRITLN